MPDGVVKTGDLELDEAWVDTINRSAPEILRDVVYESKVAAAQIRKLGGGNDLPAKVAADPVKVMSALSTHQKTKIVVDTMASLIMQREILGKIIQDALEDSRDGKLTRLALTRALMASSPKELTIDVVSKTGVMLVPVKAESMNDWLAEQGLVKTVDGTVNEPT